jgi:hypothetical protein
VSGSRSWAVFILTHGRPDNVITAKTLAAAGYTGRTYYIVDNEDPTADRYRERFGADNVVEFDKAAIAKTFDTADLSDDRRSIVYARNACFGIARDLGLDYFVELDDDYTAFLYRWTRGETIHSAQIRSFDDVSEALFQFLDDSSADCVAMSQGGDHIGGVEGLVNAGIIRKAMNSLYLRTDNPVEFLGRINEDVNTYVTLGGRGRRFFTITGLQLNQIQTQQSEGGMTDLYLSTGTYHKSFFTVMMNPSSVSVRTLGRTDRRFHHHVRWDRSVPRIVPNRLRKVAGQ